MVSFKRILVWGRFVTFNWNVNKFWTARKLFVSRNLFRFHVRKRRDNPCGGLYNRDMKLEPDICYAAAQTRDTRFDGVFFIGVLTTGIYCRPICPARIPRRDRCAFYPSAAAAERAGYRPCLRCRPELAPGHARVDATGRLTAQAAGRIEDGALSEISVEELAAELGVTGRHLRRAIQSEFGVSPMELAQTQRLLLAKRLLTDTDLLMIEVAQASGFSSLRRFNALFKERYHLQPNELRKSRAALPPETLLCELAYRPPLDWQAVTDFLVGRASCGVEAIADGRYVRAVAWKDRRGWIAAAPSPTKPVLRVEVSASLAPTLLPILARVRRLFDLSADPAKIEAHLGEIAASRPGLRVPGAFNGYEVAVRAILGQQISVKAASTLAGRFAAKFGEPLGIETPFPALTHLPPTPERVANSAPEEWSGLGIVGARAKSIVALSQAVAAKTVILEPGVDAEATTNQLKALPGIGEWTAQYIAMRALAWPDAFPHTDLGLYKALSETHPKRVLERAEAWRPWRAYAAMHLWKSLEPKPLEASEETKGTEK